MREHNDRFADGFVRVRSAPITLPGRLAIPPTPRGLVIFVHNTGSNQESPHDALVADALFEHGLATLRFDLLSAHEEEIDHVSPQFCYDHSLLAGRVVDAVDWVGGAPAAKDWPLGLMGSGTGGAAALIAAARRPEIVAAVVSRGGRVDLAAQIFGQVSAPTLLVVGANDEAVVEHNRRADEHLAAPNKRLELVPDTGHLFEEPEAMPRVAGLAAGWFAEHLQG